MTPEQQAEFERNFPKPKEADPQWRKDMWDSQQFCFERGCNFTAQQQAAAIAEAGKFEPVAHMVRLKGSNQYHVIMRAPDSFELRECDITNLHPADHLAASRQQGIEEGKKIGGQERDSQLHAEMLEMQADYAQALEREKEDGKRLGREERDAELRGQKPKCHFTERIVPGLEDRAVYWAEAFPEDAKPLYAQPLPPADLQAENARLREALENLLGFHRCHADSQFYKTAVEKAEEALRRENEEREGNDHGQ